MPQSLDPTLAQALALVTSRLLHSPGTALPYPVNDVDVFEGYRRELAQSDRDPKTKARYWQIVSSYRAWLAGRTPDVAHAKGYLADLRERRYSQRSVLLYYHALRLFHDYTGQPLKLKLRKPYSLPPYHDRAAVERLIAQAERGLYHHSERLRPRLGSAKGPCRVHRGPGWG